MNTRKLTRTSSLRRVAAASVVCLLASAQALASDAATHTLKVKYGDLNLSTLAGASTLYQRISGAARFVCGEQGRRWEERRQWNECYHHAVAEAVASVNSPMLSTVTRGNGIETAMLIR